tara:strand:- start:578 stop:895 length:318 start_codon:yes stop_codon:yes gene_type:complete
VAGSNIERVAVPDDSGVNWEEVYDDDELIKKTIPILKKYLAANCLLLGGLKKDLISRIEEDIIRKRKNGEKIGVDGGGGLKEEPDLELSQVEKKMKIETGEKRGW